MKLDEILKEIKIIDKRNYKDDIDIKGIANHTDDIKEGFLYVAIKGYISDGHKYMEKALENGAVVAVVEDFVVGLETPQIKVKNTREALSKISDNFYESPSKELRMIGVTATNGKTTTTYMLDKIFEKANIRSGMIGSVVVKIGDETIPSLLTTPESVDLQRHLRTMKEKGIEQVSMETSSSALELFRVNDIDFDIVALNNLSREHIDQHGTFERYWAAKSSLIRDAKAGAYAVLNLDDEHSASLIDKTDAKVITYSLTKEEGNIYCKNLSLKKGRAEFKVVINKPFKSLKGETIEGEFDIVLGVPGYHSAANSMAAITISLIDGISPKDICLGLREFSGVERRFQYIYEDDFVIIDDHFANKGNINVTLETLRHMEYKDLHLVYAIRGNRGVTVNRENAETIAAWKDKLGIQTIIATNSVGDVTKKDVVLKEEERVFNEVMKKNKIEVIFFDQLKEAINYSLEEVVKDDIIILAGCQGMDHGGKIALELLKEKNPDLDEEELFKPVKNRTV